MPENPSDRTSWTQRAIGSVATMEALARGLTCGALLGIAALAARRLWAPADETATIYLIGSMGICSAIGLTGWWLSGRARKGGQAVAAVEDALDACDAGERDTGALRLDPALGPRARAWNTLLDARESAESDEACRRAQRAANARGHGADELTASFESISQGILILDSRMAVTRWNGAARTLLGIESESVGSMMLTDVVDDPAIVEAAREVVSGERRPDAVELERAGEGEPSVVRVSFRPLRNDDHAAALIILDDITQRRLAERARDSFVAHATHELRTPLTNIRLHVEEALDDEDALLRSRALQAINHESRRLERTITDMLSVSEIEAGTLSLRLGEVRLGAIFEELRIEFAPQAKDKGVSLRFDLPPKYPVARADRDKLVLAVHNLIGNALKYTEPGGTVDVTVRADDSGLEVRVADSGIGIAESDLPRIFDRFYRADDERLADVAGSGLGLALAAEIARLHGGEISVQSALNEGSVFTLTASIAQADLAAAA